MKVISRLAAGFKKNILVSYCVIYMIRGRGHSKFYCNGVWSRKIVQFFISVFTQNYDERPEGHNYNRICSLNCHRCFYINTLRIWLRFIWKLGYSLTWLYFVACKFWFSQVVNGVIQLENFSFFQKSNGQLIYTLLPQG